MQQNRRVTSNPFQAFVERRLQSAFLKSGSTTEYYEILEVRVGAATLQEIKKSYRAKALKLHPDKIKQRHGRPPSDEEKAELSQIKEAYNVLIDPERRKTYDCLGERGLQVLENPSTAGTPQEIFLFAIGNFKRNNADKAWLTTILFLWVCLLITAPILVCLKADGGLQDMSWTATWFPFWIFDVFYLMDALSAVIDAGSSPALGEANVLEDEETEVPVRADPKATAIGLVQVLAIVSLQVLVMMNLDGIVTMTWTQAFIPLYLYQIIGLAQLLPMASQKIPRPDLDDVALIFRLTQPQSQNTNTADTETETETEVIHVHDAEGEVAARAKALGDYNIKVIQRLMSVVVFCYNFCFLLFAFILGMKLDEVIDWNWADTFFPLWLYIAFRYIFARWFYIEGAKELEGKDIEAIQTQIETGVQGEDQEAVKHGTALTSLSYVGCCCTIFPLMSILMLWSTLKSSGMGSDGWISAFWVSFPIWLALSMLVCLICCVSCALCTADENVLAVLSEHEHEHEESAVQAANMNGGASGAGGAGEAEPRGWAALSSSQTHAQTPPLVPTVVPVASPIPDISASTSVSASAALAAKTVKFKGKVNVLPPTPPSRDQDQDQDQGDSNDID